MGIFTTSQLSFSGEEIREIGEFVMEKTIGEETELRTIHRLDTGIKASKKIGIVGELGLIGKAGQGCDPTPDTPSATITEKTWDPKPVQMRIKECWTDWLDSFFVYFLKPGVMKSDMTDTDAAEYIQMLTIPALKKTMWRLAWFGDTNAANSDDSPAGVITPGIDVDFFNIFDGFWPQIYSIVASDSTRRYTISENAEATKSAQLALAAGKAYTILEDLYSNCDPRLIQEGNLMFVVTRSIFNNYATYLESKSTDASFIRIEGGFETLRFRGIPVINMPVWDDIIRAYFDNGTTYQYPHRAVLMRSENMPLGLEEEGSHLELDIHHDKVTRHLYTDAYWTMDAKVIQDNRIQAAY
jgi:hypothetical protein